MRKSTLIVTAVGASLVLAAAPTAVAQGNDIACPEGAASNAAGTHCTDLATGLEVEPLAIYTVFDSPNSNPCPELMYKAGDRCVEVSALRENPELRGDGQFGPQLLYDYDAGAYYYQFPDGSWEWY